MAIICASNIQHVTRRHCGRNCSRGRTVPAGPACAPSRPHSGPPTPPARARRRCTLRFERGHHRSGASMIGMLGVAVAFGVMGRVLLFVPHLVAMVLSLPLSLFLGASRWLSSSLWASSRLESPGSSCWRGSRRVRWHRGGTSCQEIARAAARPGCARTRWRAGRAGLSGMRHAASSRCARPPVATLRLPTSPAQAARLQLSSRSKRCRQAVCDRRVPWRARMTTSSSVSGASGW
jgi:hypothetical protein